MNESKLRQLIREEASKVLSENNLSNDQLEELIATMAKLDKIGVVGDHLILDFIVTDPRGEELVGGTKFELKVPLRGGFQVNPIR